MQKFRDYIYCDENKLNSYLSQIKEFDKVEVSCSYEKQTEFDGGINAPMVKAGTTLNEKTVTNYTSNSSRLEFMVNWACNDKNAINYDSEQLNLDDKDKLIVLNGKIIIPEMSENLEIINAVARNTKLFDIMPVSAEDKEKLSFIKESDNIPILLELDSDYIFNCNLKKDCLRISSDDFFDNIDEEINIIGRIEKIYNIDSDIEIFDLTKEVFKLNRAVRRKIPKENLEGAIIYEKGPLVKITPIIIYK